MKRIICLLVLALVLSLVVTGVILGINDYIGSSLEHNDANLNGSNISEKTEEQSVNSIYEANMDNVIFSLKNDESELVIHKGKLSISNNLKYYLDDDTVSKKQAYAVSIKFFSNDYEAYIVEKTKKAEDDFFAQTAELEEELNQAKQTLSSDLFHQTEQVVTERWNELERKLREETSKIKYDAYEKYIKPTLPLIEELGIDVVERVITFVQQNEVWYSEIYCVAYLDAYLIEQLNYVVSDMEFGLGIELAPAFVDRDSDIVDLTDPYFSTIVD